MNVIIHFADANDGGLDVAPSVPVPPHQLGETGSPLRKRATPSNYSSRKKARQSGMEYQRRNGQIVSKKEFVFHHCKCRQQCSKLGVEQRRNIFQSFWNTEDWQAQSNYIAGCVKTSEPQRKSVLNSRVKFVRQYHLGDIRVCKDVFLKTLQITDGRVDYCLNRKTSNGACSPDKRGSSSKNKTSAEKKQLVSDFLNSLPKYKSHYGSSDRVYLSPDLTKDKIYSLYIEKVPKEMKVSRPIFDKIFKEYNVSIYISRMDTCKYCDEYQVAIENGCPNAEEMKNSHEVHLSRAERARLELQLATSEARSNDALLVFTFDMEKTQPLPKINTSVVFYKRQLWIYNVGIHTCHDAQGLMCLWTEGEAKRGSAEICSSLYSFLQSISLHSYRKIKTFSDCCSGQNRNRNIIAFFMYICHKYQIEEWEHTYMESGHSYLPNDRDFSSIEKKSKRTTHIYSMEEWIDLVKNARKNKPYSIIRMKDRFFSLESLFKNHKKKIDISFMKLNWFRVNSSTKIVNYTLKEENQMKTCDLSNCVGDLSECDLQPLSTSHPISSAKYADLLSLLPYIPSVHHDFYVNLPHE